MLAVGLGEIGVRAIGGLVFLEDGIGQGRVEDVAELHALVLDRLAERTVLVAVQGRGIGVGVGLGEVLAAGEEEELVLDQRSADGETIGLVQLMRVFGTLGQVPVVQHLLGAARRGADQVFVEEMGIERTLDLIGTGLGDGVDRTARETALAYVEGGDHDLDLLDGIEGDRVGARLAAVGSGRRQAEGVIGHGTVDLEGVVAVVGAGEGDAAVLVEGRLRREFHHVIDAAADGRHRFDLLQVEARTGPRDAGVEGFLAHDGDGVELVDRLHHRIDLIGLAEFQLDVAVHDSRHAQERDLDLVGAADVHAVDEETAVVVGDGIILRPGRLMDSDDGRPGQRFALLIHDASDHAGGRYLRRSSKARRQDDTENAQKAFKFVREKHICSIKKFNNYAVSLKLTNIIRFTDFSKLLVARYNVRFASHLIKI